MMRCQKKVPSLIRRCMYTNQMKWNVKVPLGIILTLAVVYNVIFWSLHRVWLPSSVDTSQYPPFEPVITEDFPTVNTAAPLIPHIIHQAHIDEMIPAYFTDYIKTFQEFNPSWDYFLWTDASARSLISVKFAELLPFWDSYWTSEKKMEVVRYVVLYEYGGLFADLDLECLRPLSRLTYKYACVLTPEPFEAASITNNWPYRVTNVLMLCRPKHPFLKQILDELANYVVLESIPDAAGSSFLTSQFIAYNHLQTRFNYSRNLDAASNSPYFYKGELAESHFDAVYVSNSKYFFNQLDHAFLRLVTLFITCSTDFENMLFHQKRGCVELSKRDLFHRSPFAFTEYHWQKTWKKNVIIIRDAIYGTIHVHSVIPNCQIYSD